MPDYPRYSSKATPTTQQPSALAPEDTTGQILEQNAKIGQQVQEASVKWSNAVDTIQKTTATANRRLFIEDLKNRAANDPNYNNADQYFSEADKFLSENTKGFSSKTAETENALEADFELKIAKSQIDNIYKKKMIDVGQANALKLIDAEINNPSENSLSAIKNILAKQVQAGIFSHEYAYNKEVSANKDLGVNRVNRDIYSSQSPEEVSEVMDRISAGFYEKGGVSIDPKTKSELYNVAEKTKATLSKEVEKKLSFQQNQGEEAIASLILSDASRPEAISTFEALHKRGDISDAAFQSAKKSLETTNAGESKTETWIQLMMDYSKINQQTDKVQAVRNFRNEVLNKKSSLSEKHYKEMLELSGAKKLEISTPKMNGLQKLVQGFKKFFEKKEEQAKTDPALVKNFTETVEKFLSDQYKPGQEVSRAGRKFRVVTTDDGSIGFEAI